MKDRRFTPTSAGGPVAPMPRDEDHTPSELTAHRATHVAPPGAQAMNILRWVLFAGLLVLAVVTTSSYIMSMRHAPGASATHKQARYYCPMHPTYTSDRPGECPICGMTLEPIPPGGIAAASGAGTGDVPGLTSVHLATDRVQMIGVRTAVVEKRPVGNALDLVGFVTPDESRLKRIQIRAAGWVQELFVNRTGDQVTAGQPLLTLYSPELFQSEQEYLIEARARAQRDTSAAGGHAEMTGHDADGAAAALMRLTLLGVPAEELARLQRVPVAVPRLTLRSTVNGTVLEKNVTEGQYVAADAPLFTIADLGTVWVLADLYEMDFGRVRAGDRATFVADALPGRQFPARIEFVYPTVSSDTRTLKVRLSLANAGGAIKPGMYGRVRVSGHAGGSALTVPGEAVVNTGEHEYVFLARGGGTFEPRMVWTGAQDGDRVQILKGVAEGDTVVASASFLIDSESRLKAAIAGMGQQPSAGHQH